MLDGSAQEAPIVVTSLGPARGAIEHSGNGSAIRVFRGIPYALPPTGEHRWQPPRPIQHWDGELDATAFGPDCPQAVRAGMLAPGMSEDCLYLNIWVPQGAEPNSLPVMVWFHGGGFVGGSGADVRTNGVHLASEGVVVVTFNYRVGIFGYLAHPQLSAQAQARGGPPASGNYGFQDQLCALRWVQSHIAAFGGNPARVTAFGVSAGSASIALMLASPAAKGLFSQAILHSPGTARPLATLEAAEAAGLAVANNIQELRSLPTDSVFSLAKQLIPAVRGLTTPRILRPIKDGWLLPEDERDVFLAGRQHAMPLLLGTNADEGSKLTTSWPLESLEDYQRQLDANFADAYDEVRECYPVTDVASVRNQVAQMFGDTQFNYGTRLLARAMAARDMPTWRYLFTRRRPDQPDGPHHGDEVSHVFGTLESVARVLDQQFDDVDLHLSNIMVHAWTQFALTGVPVLGNSTTWPAYEDERDLHLELGDKLQRGAGWRETQLDFLDALYSRRAAGAA